MSSRVVFACCPRHVILARVFLTNLTSLSPALFPLALHIEKFSNLNLVRNHFKHMFFSAYNRLPYLHFILPSKAGKPPSTFLVFFLLLGSALTRSPVFAWNQEQSPKISIRPASSIIKPVNPSTISLIVALPAIWVSQFLISNSFSSLIGRNKIKK